MCTELSKYIWNLKSQAIVATIKLKIMKTIKNKVSCNYCKLCLTEKLYITETLEDKNVLIKKPDLVSKCRHQKKF